MHPASCQSLSPRWFRQAVEKRYIRLNTLLAQVSIHETIGYHETASFAADYRNCLWNSSRGIRLLLNERTPGKNPPHCLDNN